MRFDEQSGEQLNDRQYNADQPHQTVGGVRRAFELAVLGANDSRADPVLGEDTDNLENSESDGGDAERRRIQLTREHDRRDDPAESAHHFGHCQPADIAPQFVAEELADH